MNEKLLEEIIEKEFDKYHNPSPAYKESIRKNAKQLLNCTLGIELTENELNTLLWISGQANESVANLISIINKIKQANNER